MKIKYQPEEVLKDYAADFSRTITHRETGERKTTKREAEKLYTIAYGALLTINFVGRADDAYSMIQGAKDCAEFTFDLMFPDCNGYDSLYCKLDRYIRDNREE